MNTFKIQNSEFNTPLNDCAERTRILTLPPARPRAVVCLGVAVGCLSAAVVLLSVLRWG